MADNTTYAYIAGGCFWCVEADMEKLDGVLEATSGYMGGHVEDPTYEQVSAGTTGHLETARIEYDPARLSYRQLLDFFLRHIDPTDPDGQFADRGAQYAPAIFVQNNDERAVAEEALRELGNSGPFDKPIAVAIRDATTFYPAEDYHQDYYRKNPFRYKSYRFFSGRSGFIDQHWGKGAN